MPTFICNFSDGEQTRMTIHCPKGLDVARGVIARSLRLREPKRKGAARDAWRNLCFEPWRDAGDIWCRRFSPDVMKKGCRLARPGAHAPERDDAMLDALATDMILDRQDAARPGYHSLRGEMASPGACGWQTSRASRLPIKPFAL
jgi:hypothetical protein